MASTCRDFKPHQLRPERCRYCFQDKSKHSQLAQQQSVSNNSQSLAPVSKDNFKYSSTDSSSKYIDNSYSTKRRPSEENNSFQASTDDSKLSADGAQLAEKHISSVNKPTKPTVIKNDGVPNNTFRYDVKIKGSQDVVSNTIPSSDANEATDVQNFKKLKEELDNIKQQLQDSMADRSKKEKENLELQNTLKRLEQSSSGTRQWNSGQRIASDDIINLQKRNRELEHINEDYRDEIKCLKLEMKELSEEYQMKLNATNTNINQIKEVDDASSNSVTSTKIEEILRDQNAKLKEEIKMLEQELDEIQDTFKEEESDQLESLKQDLDLASKNCRILQFKLKKSERQYAQLEQVKVTLEKQLEDMCLKKPEQLSSLLSSESRAYNSNINSRSLDGPTIVLGASEYDQLIRDLHDTMEREKDLQEQIKYCQEESRANSEKLLALESENEILTTKVSKLLETKSHVSAMALLGRQKLAHENNSNNNSKSYIASDTNSSNLSELLQQIEQLKLGLEISQRENSNLKMHNNKLKLQLEQSDTKLKVLQKKLDENAYSSEVSTTGDEGDQQTCQRLQIECRRLRTKLLESDRENRQLRTRLDLSSNSNQNKSNSSNMNNHSENSQMMLNRSAVFNRSRSLEQQPQFISDNTENNNNGQQISKYKAELSMMRTQNDMLMRQNSDLQDKIRTMIKDNKNTLDNNALNNIKHQESHLESEFIEQMKDQLQSLEEELTSKKSKIVELDLDNSRLQREYKKLKQSLECKRVPSRLNQLREISTRQELRDIIRELEEDLNEAQSVARGKEAMLESCQEELNQLIETCDKFKLERDTMAKAMNETQLTLLNNQQNDSGSIEYRRSQENKNAPKNDTDNDLKKPDEKTEAYKQQLEKERFCNSNLKNDIRRLESSKNELATLNRMLERERVSMEEEVDKLRAVNKQQLDKIDELTSMLRSTNNRVTELNITNDRIKNEMNILQKKLDNQQRSIPKVGSAIAEGSVTSKYQSLERECDDLRAKNLFLINKIDGIEFEFKSKADEIKAQFDSQKKREMDLARLEVKEKLQIEMQNIREELSEARQKLATATRQQSKADYELRTLDEKYKSLDKEFKREKARLSTKIDQLEQDLDFERRKQDHLEREKDSQLKDKSRQLMNVQDTCVQLERDLKRAQAKLSTAESDFDSRVCNLAQELSKEKREKEEMIQKCRKTEENYYDQKMRFESEKATMVEAIDSVRRSYDEKIDEIKSVRELLTVRQDQHFKEKLLMQEKLQSMEATIGKLTTLEYDFRQLKNRCETQEANLDQFKKDERSLREEKTRLKTRCEDLERKCSYYEKQELVSKTSSISPTGIQRTASINSRNTMNVKPSDYETTKLEQLYNELETTKAQLSRALEENSLLTKKLSDSSANRSEYSLSEKLTGKINDQRHHMKTLKTQIDSLVAELKNTNLLHKAEKSSWQVQMAQLSSNLNEKEERLLLETSSRLATRNLAKTKMEIAWQKERQTTQDLLLKQQDQIQVLTEDLRQTIQLLESTKEARQRDNRRHQEALVSMSSNQSSKNINNKVASEQLRHQLDTCESERSKLQQKLTGIEKYNEKAVDTILKDLEPLLPIIAKILSSLEKPVSAKDEQTDEENHDSDNTTGVQSSTNRPLRTISKYSNPPDDGGDEASLASEIISHTSLSKAFIDSKGASGNPVSASSGRFSRFLKMKPSPVLTSDSSVLTDSKNSTNGAQQKLDSKVKTKSLRKVKIKSSSLGISASEKKQMKLCLKKLEKSIEDIKSLPSAQDQTNKLADYTKRTSLIEQGTEVAKQRQELTSYRGTSYTPTRTFSDTNKSLSKYWNSGIESEGSSPASSLLNMEDSVMNSDHYRRFPSSGTLKRHLPLATPKPSQSFVSSWRAGIDSATDYDSESSLASDILNTTAKSSLGSYKISGTESDSGMRNSSSVNSGKTSQKKKNLKSRFQDTLRNISRSITGLTSDNESDNDTHSSNTRGRDETNAYPTERPKQFNTLV